MIFQNPQLDRTLTKANFRLIDGREILGADIHGDSPSNGFFLLRDAQGDYQLLNANLVERVYLYEDED